MPNRKTHGVDGYAPRGQKPMLVIPLQQCGRHVVLPMIVAAAIMQGGKVYYCEQPCRHHHVIWAKCQLDGAGFNASQVQGFLTNDGRFLDRREARTIAVANGQSLKPCHQTDLFSEDLW